MAAGNMKVQYTLFRRTQRNDTGLVKTQVFTCVEVQLSSMGVKLSLRCR